MQNHYAQIWFSAANYSRLQGLRTVPVGILSVFVSIWALYNQGSSANLSQPILVAVVIALLHWLVDLYYKRMFGQVKQTPRQRQWEFVISAGGGFLALLAFIFDTMEILPISILGLVLAVSFFEYIWRVNRSEWKNVLVLFPENTAAAILIAIISLLPLFGISFWHILGIESQIVGIVIIFGIMIILGGVWGHIRLLRNLPLREGGIR